LIKLITCILILIGFSKKASAEYRVYQYLVKPKMASSMATQMDAKIQRSTLNPVSFLAYHGGASAIDATLVRSWMCPGSTARKDFCRHPSERVNQ
jgi:hypothetical protein